MIGSVIAWYTMEGNALANTSSMQHGALPTCTAACKPHTLLHRDVGLDTSTQRPCRCVCPSISVQQGVWLACSSACGERKVCQQCCTHCAHAHLRQTKSLRQESSQQQAVQSIFSTQASSNWVKSTSCELMIFQGSMHTEVHTQASLRPGERAAAPAMR